MKKKCPICDKQLIDRPKKAIYCSGACRIAGFRNRKLAGKTISTNEKSKMARQLQKILKK